MKLFLFSLIFGLLFGSSFYFSHFFLRNLESSQADCKANVLSAAQGCFLKEGLCKTQKSLNILDLVKNILYRHGSCYQFLDPRGRWDLFQWETLCILGRMQQFIVEIHKMMRNTEGKKKHWKRVSLLNLWFWPRPDQAAHAGIKGTRSGNVYDCIYICVCMYVSSPRRAAGK